MSKTKKVLSIILISLLILSTILTLCKKVGLCASDISSVYPYEDFPPYLWGNGISGSGTIVSTSLLQNIIDDAINRNSSYNGGSVVIIRYSTTNYVIFPDLSPSYDSNSVLSVLNIHYSVSYEYSADGNYLNRSFTNGYLDFSPNSARVQSASGSYIYDTSQVCNGYVLYVHNEEDFVYDTGLQVFSHAGNQIPVIPDGHLKGGVLSNYIDSEDLLENSSDMPSFDFTPPTTQQSFWDKLFGFFSRSFKSFNSWLLTIGDLIGQVIDKLEEVYNKMEEFFGRVFETIFSWLENIFNKLGSSDDHLDQVEDNTSGLPSFMTSTSSWMQNFWGNFKSNLGDFVENNLWGKLPDFMKAPFRIASWFYNHGLKNGEFDFLTLWEYLFDFDSQTAYAAFQNNKYGDFILDVRDFFSNFITSITGVTASDRVFFTISLGDYFGVYIPDIEIDFAWYASIRDQYLPYFMAFLYVTVIWLFFKRLPDILKGVAGAESSFMDNLPREYDTYETIFSKDVVTTIETHSNRSRSGAVIDKTIESHKR